MDTEVKNVLLACGEKIGQLKKELKDLRAVCHIPASAVSSISWMNALRISEVCKDYRALKTKNDQDKEQIQRMEHSIQHLLDECSAHDQHADQQRIEIEALTGTIKCLHKQRMKPTADNIDFVLPPRYFQPHSTANGMERCKCLKVLKECFGLFDGTWETLMQNNSGTGFHIVCRPDQFARFIIRRHQIGNCINGIRDLDPTYRRHRPTVRTHDIIDVVDGN
jgi:hypothetical protein